MKIVKKEDNGKGKPIIWFATNEEEMRLILGMAETTLLHLPKTINLTRTKGRLQNFIKEIRKSKIC